MNKRGCFPVAQKLFLIPLVVGAMALGGCNALRVYTIDLPQGNCVTQEMAAKLKPGMTQSQVRYLLGSPMVTDTLNANRWDYLYAFRAGTYAKAAGIKDITQQHLTLIFENGKLSTITGLETLPEKSPTTILSKDGGLRAEPL